MAAVDVPLESTWGDLPKGACVFLVHPDGRILGRQDKHLDLPVWHAPTDPRHKGESARENAVRILAEQTGLAVRPTALQPLHSGPQPEEGGWRFLDAFWLHWSAEGGDPLASGEAGYLVAWISIETILAQREASSFEAEAIGHLAALLHGAALA